MEEKIHFLSPSKLRKRSNVTVRTIQSWEAGTRVPTHSALRLLEIIDKGIYRPKIQRKSV